MNKTLVFDLDGTIVDFYGVDGWLDDLHNESTRPYDIAKPLYNMEVLNAILDCFYTFLNTTYPQSDLVLREIGTEIAKKEREELSIE